MIGNQTKKPGSSQSFDTCSQTKGKDYLPRLGNSPLTTQIAEPKVNVTASQNVTSRIKCGLILVCVWTRRATTIFSISDTTGPLVEERLDSLSSAIVWGTGVYLAFLDRRDRQTACGSSRLVSEVEPSVKCVGVNQECRQRCDWTTACRGFWPLSICTIE
jgi:hypothetical protein